MLVGLAHKPAVLLLHNSQKHRGVRLNKTQTRLQQQQQQQKGKQQQQQQQPVTMASAVMVPMEARHGHHPSASLTTSSDSSC